MDRHHVVIDGNNLLHAMREHAPLPGVGRETLVKIVERWARRGTDDVTLVFDGAAPPGGLSRQMSSPRISVRFAAPRSADDVIVAIVESCRHPDRLRVVSADSAIGYAARSRRCGHTKSPAFVGELFAGAGEDRLPASPFAEKPEALSEREREEWLREFEGPDAPDPSTTND